MNKLLGRTQLFVRRNASTILTCMGGVGVVATSVMAVKATPKALEILEQAKMEKGEELTKMEVVKVAGPVYIPSILVGASTLACIFGANALNKHSQAAIMSAYAMLDNSYKEYKKKVEEMLGEEADGQIRDEIVKDHYEETAIPEEEDGKQLFYDEFSGRYFRSTLYDVQRAEYELNRDMVMREYAYLNEFYEHLGIDGIEGGYDLGWSPGANQDHYWQEWIDFMHSKVVMDDGLEVTIIRMSGEPMMNFADYC